MTDEQVNDLVAVNVCHPTYLTRVALEHLVERKEKSCIVNIGSLMDVNPIPGFTIYAGSKAYINSFTSALTTELSLDSDLPGKVDICNYCPGAVSTKLNGLP